MNEIPQSAPGTEYTPESSYTIPAPSIMLLGESGAGKTYCLRTLLDCGITPFILFTDPGMSVLGDIAGPPNDCKVHWVYIPPFNPTWDTLIDAAKKINTLSHESLTKMPDMNKSKYGQFIDVYRTLSNFKCNRCQQEFGPVDSWPKDRAIIIDNLSGLSKLSMDMTVGGKPVRSQANWGVAMDNLENFVLKFSTGIPCWAIMIAHLEYEVDEVSGTTRLMASTLGRKLSPKLPRTFDEVIEVVRVGSDFSWRSASGKVATKARYLPLSEKLEPNFKTIFEAWQRLGGA